MVDRSDAAFPYVDYANQKESIAKGRSASRPFLSMSVGLVMLVLAGMQVGASEINWGVVCVFLLAAIIHFSQAFWVLRSRRT